jgi:hypothetical protein
MIASSLVFVGTLWGLRTGVLAVGTESALIYGEDRLRLQSCEKDDRKLWRNLYSDGCGTEANDYWNVYNLRCCYEKPE